MKDLGNKEAFYVALEKGLHNYLKAKLNIETTEFSKEKITNILTGKQVAQEDIKGFIGLLTSCEMARYSPFSNVQMQIFKIQDFMHCKQHLVINW